MSRQVYSVQQNWTVRTSICVLFLLRSLQDQRCYMCSVSAIDTYLYMSRGCFMPLKVRKDLKAAMVRDFNRINLEDKKRVKIQPKDKTVHISIKAIQILWNFLLKLSCRNWKPKLNCNFQNMKNQANILWFLWYNIFEYFSLHGLKYANNKPLLNWIVTITFHQVHQIYPVEGHSS